jgi:hypothetical protein
MIAVWQEDGMDAGKVDGRPIRINRDQRAGDQIIGGGGRSRPAAIMVARSVSLTARGLLKPNADPAVHFPIATRGSDRGGW